MRRREFIAFVGNGVAAATVAARAQQPERIRKVGMLMNFSVEDPEAQPRVKAYAQALQKLGWIEGGNVRTEIRWAADDADRYRRYSEELVALAPDVIVASGSASVVALQRATHSVPIVFANVIDPVGAGFVTSMARPGGNATGFTAFEYSLSGKWLESLKEIAPNLTRVAVLRGPSIAAGIGQFAAIQAMASSSGVELSVIDPADTSGIERAFAAFAHQPNGGVIVTGSTATAVHRELIISLLMRYRLPNIAVSFWHRADHPGLLAHRSPWSDKGTYRTTNSSEFISLRPKFEHLKPKQNGWSVSRQFVEKRLGALQDRRVKTFSEPTVDRHEEITGFGALALITPEACEAGGGAQLPEFRALPTRNGNCLVKTGLSTGEISDCDEQLAPGAMHVTFGPALLSYLDQTCHLV
jgi:putative tryptophan/tyrosine transport system substrate-binding protein